MASIKSGIAPEQANIDKDITVIRNMVAFRVFDSNRKIKKTIVVVCNDKVKLSPQALKKLYLKHYISIIIEQFFT